MTWKLHGPIFQASNENLSSGYQFAQGPQALILGEITRVFFSSRISDAPGKYISRVFYADFTNDLNEIIDVSKTPVIEGGNLGTFDEHGIFPFHPFVWNGNVFAYTCGWSRRKSVDIDMSIGHAFSTDGGNTFTRSGPGPVLAASPDEPFLIGDPFALVSSGNVDLYYIFGTDWTKSSSGVPERTYRIGHLSTYDPIALGRERSGKQIIEALSPTEAQAMPSVLEVNGKRYMFFCYRDSFDFREKGSSNAYRLGFAFCNEGDEWQRFDEFLPSFSGDNDFKEDLMQCYPNVHRRGDTVYLIYNGNEFGRNGFNLATIGVGDLP